MATHDYNIANQIAVNLREDINDALEAIVSTNSNATAPTTTYQYMWWYDTTNDLLKMRDESNSAWITIGYVDQSNLNFQPYIGGTQVTEVLDEDDMASDSDTAIPSQQSVKAYVDSRPSAVEFISSVDASNDSVLDFTGFDSSKYDSYKFTLSNVVPSSDDVLLRVRTSSDGGTNFDDGSSDYKFAITGGTSLEFGFIQLTGSNAIGSSGGEHGVSGSVEVFGPHLIKDTQVTFSVCYATDSGGIESVTGSGFRNSASSTNAIRFFFNSGNIESGTITMYGMRNSA